MVLSVQLLQSKFKKIYILKKIFSILYIYKQWYIVFDICLDKIKELLDLEDVKKVSGKGIGRTLAAKSIKFVRNKIVDAIVIAVQGGFYKVSGVGIPQKARKTMTRKATVPRKPQKATVLRKPKITLTQRR